MSDLPQLSKTKWQSNGDEIRLGMDFSKVDKQRRVVAGWATIDNVDTENDVVTAEASIDAFNRSRLNLREMHKKDSAVGRVVSFKEDSFTAPDGKTYNGIFVKVRVSEGANDTWLKVLDGTLNGFSIGGAIIESEETFQKDSGATIRKVTKYDLNELSLVDNPGNQYSDITNVFKIKKSADGSVTSLTGMVEEQKVLNVFYCSEDLITKESPGDSYECPICDNKMTTIGFVEDTPARGEKVGALVTKFIGTGAVPLTKVKTEEVEKVESLEPAEEIADEKALDTPEVNTDEDPEPVGKDVDEVHDESEEILKKIDSFKTDISDILTQNNTETSEKIEALEKAVSETKDFFEKKIEEFDTRFDTINKNLDVAKSRQEAFEEKLEKINSGSAIKKSADFDKSAGKEQKSNEVDWNGAFSVNDLFR